jgi:hypothetical protein
LKSEGVPVAEQFLINAALTRAFVAIPTIFIWLRSGRRLPLSTSYHRALLHVVRFSGLAFLSISGLNLLFAFSDLVGASCFGYPAYSVLVIALFMAIGYGVWRVASWWLRWHISMHQPSD